MVSPNLQEQTQKYLSKVSDIYNMIALTGLPERNRELHHVLLDKIAANSLGDLGVASDTVI